ncbi:MAG: MBL fold metallo-hydrolase [Methanomassiliicoccales archaeon]
MTVHCLPGVGLDSNIYVVTGSDPFLVDTGTGVHTKSILGQISEIVPPSRIDRIILTHRHFDHVGGARFLMRSLDAEVYIHELDAPPLVQGDGWATLAKFGGIRMEPVEVHPLSEGCVFSTGDHEFVVYHTPGHSEGSIVLIDKITGALICGDLLFVGGVGRWDLPSGSYDDLVRSLRRLLLFEITDLYPGHGPYSLKDARMQVLRALDSLGEV